MKTDPDDQGGRLQDVVVVDVAPQRHLARRLTNLEKSVVAGHYAENSNNFKK